MPETDNDPITLHALSKDVAVLANEMTHVKGDISGIRMALEKLSVVSQTEFEQYKIYVDQTYVKKSDINALQKFWNLLTSSLGKLIAAALIAVVLYAIVQTSNIQNPFKQ